MLEYITSHLSLSLEEIRDHPEWLINAFDHNHQILLWNKKCEDFFKIDEASALGRKLEDILPYTKGNEKMVYLQRALSGIPIHILNDRFSNRKEIYEQRLIPIRDQQNKVIAALNIVSFQVT